MKGLRTKSQVSDRPAKKIRPVSIRIERGGINPNVSRGRVVDPTAGACRCGCQGIGGRCGHCFAVREGIHRNLTQVRSIHEGSPRACRSAQVGELRQLHQRRGGIKSVVLCAIELDLRTQRGQVELDRAALRVLRTIGELRNDSGGQDGHNHHYNQYFDQRKCRAAFCSLHEQLPRITWELAGWTRFSSNAKWVVSTGLHPDLPACRQRWLPFTLPSLGAGFACPVVWS